MSIGIDGKIEGSGADEDKGAGSSGASGASAPPTPCALSLALRLGCGRLSSEDGAGLLAEAAGGLIRDGSGADDAMAEAPIPDPPRMPDSPVTPARADKKRDALEPLPRGMGRPPKAP
jgi:hypothetical protein